MAASELDRDGGQGGVDLYNHEIETERVSGIGVPIQVAKVGNGVFNVANLYFATI